MVEAGLFEESFKAHKRKGFDNISQLSFDDKKRVDFLDIFRSPASMKWEILPCHSRNEAAHTVPIVSHDTWSANTCKEPWWVPATMGHPYHSMAYDQFPNPVNILFVFMVINKMIEYPKSEHEECFVIVIYEHIFLWSMWVSHRIVYTIWILL